MLRSPRNETDLIMMAMRREEEKEKGEEAPTRFH
jgi:hypothetical protein